MTNRPGVVPVDDQIDAETEAANRVSRVMDALGRAWNQIPERGNGVRHDLGRAMATLELWRSGLVDIARKEAEQKRKAP